MTKEQQELLDKAYENYHNYFLGYDDIPNKELFILACKTDTKLAERWGLKFEERELSVIERIVIAETSTEIISGFDSHFDTDEDVHKVLDTWDVPTKLITLTYNNETLDSYE